MPDSLFGQRKADQTAPIGRHEIDRLRGDLLCGHAEVALIFAVFVIHEDDHAAAANLFNRRFNRR
jgi:hypothetical protein